MCHTLLLGVEQDSSPAPACARMGAGPARWGTRGDNPKHTHPHTHTYNTQTRTPNTYTQTCPHLAIQQATPVELARREGGDGGVHAVLRVQHPDRVAAALRSRGGGGRACVQLSTVAPCPHDHMSRLSPMPATRCREEAPRTLSAHACSQKALALPLQGHMLCVNILTGAHVRAQLLSCHTRRPFHARPPSMACFHAGLGTPEGCTQATCTLLRAVTCSRLNRLMSYACSCARLEMTVAGSWTGSPTKKSWRGQGGRRG